MKFTEKRLLATYFNGGSYEESIRTRIQDIPKKYLSSITASILKDFKMLEIKGLPLTDISKNKNYNKILCDILDEVMFYTSENIDEIEKSLQQKYLKNQVKEISEYEPYEIEEAVSDLYSEMVKTQSTGVKKATSKDVEKIFFDSFDQVDYVKTGEVRFSSVLKLTKRDLHIIGARPGVGKSAFALYLTLMLAKHNRGIFFSLEMPITQITKRIVASKTKIPLKKMDSMKDLREADKERIKKYFSEYKELDLTIYDGNFKIEKLEEIVKFEKEINGLDFIIVDYLQLIQSRKGSRYEQITDISIRLKQLAKQYDIAVIALSQLSREIEKRVSKEIFLSDFRDSGQIEQDASIILGLTTDEVRDKLIKDKFLMTVSILKNRQGTVGKLLYEYYKNNQLLIPISTR